MRDLALPEPDRTAGSLELLNDDRASATTLAAELEETPACLRTHGPDAAQRCADPTHRHDAFPVQLAGGRLAFHARPGHQARRHRRAARKPARGPSGLPNRGTARFDHGCVAQGFERSATARTSFGNPPVVLVISNQSVVLRTVKQMGKKLDDRGQSVGCSRCRNTSKQRSNLLQH